MSSGDQAATASIANVANLATACDGVFLGLALAYFSARSWVKYLASSSALRRIRHAPTARVSDLRSLLSSAGDSSSDESAGRLVVVRGQVQPKSTAESIGPGPDYHSALISQGSSEMAVVVEQTQTYLYNDCRALFGWIYDIQTLFTKTWNEQCRNEQRSCSLRSVPFVLVEGGQWSQSGHALVSLDGSTHPLPLTTVYHHLRPVESSPYSSILSFLGYRYPVALLDERKILPVGKEITAVGICKMQYGALEIKSCSKLPCFLSDMTKEEIEADLTIDTKILFWSGILLGTLSAGILGYAIIRNWQKWKDFWKRMQNQELHHEDPTQSSVDEELVNVPDGELCVICLMRPRIYVFVPCGHRVCCQHCALSLQSNCPLCWQSIQSSMTIYTSEPAEFAGSSQYEMLEAPFSLYIDSMRLYYQLSVPNLLLVHGKHLKHMKTKVNNYSARDQNWKPAVSVSDTDTPPILPDTCLILLGSIQFV